MKRRDIDDVLTGLKQHVGDGYCEQCPYDAIGEGEDCTGALLRDVERVFLSCKNTKEKTNFRSGNTDPTHEDVRANGTNEFLCVVLTPAGGGRAQKQYMVIAWDECDAEWVCDECIVEKWAYLPDCEN